MDLRNYGNKDIHFEGLEVRILLKVKNLLRLTDYIGTNIL